MIAALPGLTLNESVLPLTVRAVVLGAPSVPLGCTLCPPRVIPLAAVRPLAVRFSLVAEV
jgi:hypothetical protein